jgi:hypothetical protein
MLTGQFTLVLLDSIEDHKNSHIKITYTGFTSSSESNWPLQIDYTTSTNKAKSVSVPTASVHIYISGHAEISVIDDNGQSL